MHQQRHKLGGGKRGQAAVNLFECERSLAMRGRRQENLRVSTCMCSVYIARGHMRRGVVHAFAHRSAAAVAPCSLICARVCNHSAWTCASCLSCPPRRGNFLYDVTQSMCADPFAHDITAVYNHLPGRACPRPRSACRAACAQRFARPVPRPGRRACRRRGQRHRVAPHKQALQKRVRGKLS
jgi:hypothetical protein